jgi:GT2 family glycosyltransferase
LKLLSKPRNAWRETLQSLKQGLRAANRQRLYRRRMKKGVDYAAWIATHDTPTAQDRVAWQLWLDANPHAPTITLVLPVSVGSDVDLLARSIASVRAQVYTHWQLIVAPQEDTSTRLLASAAEDARIQVLSTRDDPLAQAKGAWVGLLLVGDQWREQALLTMVQAAQAHPDAKIIYADEDRIDRQHRRSAHHFKPDWNHDFQLSANYIGRACLTSLDHLNAAGGYARQPVASDAFDATLRCIDGLQAHHIVHVPQVLWHDGSPGSTAMGAPFVQALQAHLDRASPGAQAIATPEGLLRVQYALPAPPLASIVICTRNQYKLLHTCVQSITQKTTYPRYEIIIVDNGSDDALTLDYLQQLPQQDARVRVIRDDSPFNYSALNNMAVAHAHGEVIALLNNDIEVIERDWLTEMVSHALRPEVGCVGAKLLYPNETVQHVGILVGGGEKVDGLAIATHYLRGLDKDQVGYGSRAMATMEVSGVTGACLVIRRATFLAVDGLNAQQLAVAYNDVDFCLRISELGLKHILAPRALLYHHESISRGRDKSRQNASRFTKELTYMRSRWVKQLQADAMYNPNLSSTAGDFLLK